MMNTLRSRLTPSGRRRIRPRNGRRLAAAAVVGAIALVGGCGTGTSTTVQSDSTSPVSKDSHSVTPVAATTVAGVYFMVDTRTGLRLAREMRDLPKQDAAKQAVTMMIAGPTDPDYASPWNTRTKVLGVSRKAQTITVNLSHQALKANIGSEGAALMVQQLVYTVTDPVDKKAKVRLLVDGKKPGDLWGVVRWDNPVGRADPMDVRSLMQIDSPREGAASSSPLLVKGEAAAFEATVPWQVLNAKGKKVKSGFTMSAEGQTFAPFSFKVRLKPGKYTVEIVEDDPSGGEGGPPMRDSKTVTIK